MKKRNLLAMAALSCFAFSANAAEYWVIKDGKLNENIVQMTYDETADPIYDKLTDGDATTGATYQHNEATYKDVQLDLTKLPVSLKSTWVLEMEYKVPASALDATGLSSTLWGDKKPMFIFGMWGETPSSIDITKADINIAIDGKFSAQADTWTTVTKYVYANPSIDSCKVMVLSYCREVAETLDPIYIKNLKFHDCGIENRKPFYAEDFQAVGTKRQPVYSPNSNAAKFKDSQLAGGKALVSTDLIELVRMWEANGSDGSNFMDDENYHALLVPKGGADISIQGIEIPADNAGVIYFKAYIKNKWEEGSGFEFATDEQRLIPAFIKFDNGTEVALTDSLMEGTWEQVTNAIAIPAGATTADLIFKSNSEFGYLVDNIRMGITWGGDKVAAISSDLAIEVSPNPASDIITVSGDVEKIEVIALNGAIVASAEGNQANIAALAAGSYIVKAYTAEGIAFKSIIKK